MRKILVVGALVGSAFVIHCSSPEPAHLDTLPTTQDKTTDNTTKKTAPPTQSNTTQVASHPIKTTAADAGTKATGPGPSCQALSTCCSKLTNSTQQTSCLQTAGKANEKVCTAAETTFSCSTLTAAPTTHGPSCTNLTSGALYCGNDGPNGDPTILYLCTGTTITIERLCGNGCTINDGTDDACTTTTGGTPPAATASCQGLSGDYCGTDGPGGATNTLYTCTNNAIATTTVCANGCLTNTDATVNDSCAAAPPPMTVSCTGLPDESFCGADLGGDVDTLYTCANGAVSDQTLCTSGCTVAAANVSDFCSSTTADCSGQTDGTYCGTNGVMGDASTLYTCTDGSAQPFPTVCTNGCFAGDFGGSDSCN